MFKKYHIFETVIIGLFLLSLLLLYTEMGRQMIGVWFEIMKEVKTLEEYKLKIINEYDKNISELYLLVENQCQEEIELVDMVRLMESLYDLIINKIVSETKINDITEENNILKELLVQKEIALYSETIISNK